MIVFHTSNTPIPQPDVLHPRKYLDFGQGFYVTPTKMQAVNYAQRFTKWGEDAFLNSYEMAAPTRIQTKMENNRIDATFTNDPVQILSTPLFGKPDIPASDDKIRIRCDESLMYIHRNFIDQNSNKLWHLINDFLSK